MSEPNLIVVGGTYKAGTRSLFTYLGAHPRVCACTLKEPGYFLPKAFGFGNRIDYESDGLATYRALFDVRAGQDWMVEATPAYLYSPEAARAIRTHFPRAHVVFCLRDPIERLRSWHSMLRHLRQIPPGMTFTEYAGQQLDTAAGRAPPVAGFPGRGLRDGRYVDALAPWLAEFGSARCEILWFDDLSQRPRAVMENLCEKLDLPASPYQGYEFKAHNRAVYLRYWWLWSGYRRLKAAVASRLRPGGRLGRLLRRARIAFERRYEALINRPVEHEPLDPSIERRLVEYYRDDVRALAALVGRAPPWQPRYERSIHS